MEQNEKRYRIEKIEKYNKQIEEKDNLIFQSTVMTGTSALFAALLFTGSISTNTSETFQLILGLISSGVGSLHLLRVVKSIIEKTVLKSMKLDAQSELTEDELEMITNLKKVK